jgi:hypothetical protein
VRALSASCTSACGTSATRWYVHLAPNTIAPRKIASSTHFIHAAIGSAHVLAASRNAGRRGAEGRTKARWA